MKNKKIIYMLLFGILLPSIMFSQYNLWFYGKNKVMRQTFNWSYVTTPHYQIYHYTDNKALVQKVAEAAEIAYGNISRYLNLKIKRKIPLIFYLSHIDFEQTNIIGYVPQGVLAFAQSNTYRVVIQGDASLEELARTITHEMGHIFEYESIGYRGARISSPPLWVIEGFSEFVTQHWDHFAELTVRDAVLTERIPQMDKSGRLQASSMSQRVLYYDFGHLAYEFLDHKFGRRGIQKLLGSLRGGSLFGSRGNLIKRVFDYTPKEFNFEFGKYVRDKYKEFLFRENPEDYSIRIGPDLPFAYSFSHQVSPSGELLAALTYNIKNYDLDFVLISLKEGKIIKNITPGYSAKWDNINLRFNPTDGNSFCWNRESDTIAFFVRKEFDSYLVLLDVMNGKTLKQIKIEKIQEPTSPNFHPDNHTLYFTGLDQSTSKIYSIDTRTGKVTPHTNGRLFIKGLGLSPDGRRVVFSAKDKTYYKLYIAPLANPNRATKITSGKYNDITPVFSNDGKMVYYSSDELKSFNINGIDLDKKTMMRFTNVKTGNFFPLEIPGEKKQVVISSYYKGQFSLYKVNTATYQDQRILEFEDFDKPMLAQKSESTLQVKKDELALDFKTAEKYRPLNKLYVSGLPSVGASIGTDGSFWGYSYLTLSDLMGDHNFTFLISSQYGYRSYHLSYLNRRSRLQYYGHLYSMKSVWYTGYNYSNYITTREMFGAEAGIFYPFNRSYRAEATISLYNQEEDSDLLAYGIDLPYGQYYNGLAAPLQVSLVGETTGFARYGPNFGHTFRISFSKYFKFSSDFMDAYTIDADLRKYFRLDNHTLFAFRAVGKTSGGKNPMIFWSGGNNTIRSSNLYSVTGNNLFFFNAEFRFSIIQLALTPLGIIGPVRGVVFFDLGGAWYNEQDFRVFKSGDKLTLQDALASYGWGVEVFFLGIPMHFEWVYRTNFDSTNYWGLNFWIGYDF